jgi:protein tyrosine/serine phosphatase
MTCNRLAVMLLLVLTATASAQERAAPPTTPPVIHSAYGDKLRLPGLPNLGKVNDSLYRGAQPHAAGIQQLKNLGITTIVDLRVENPTLRDTEKREAEALGIRFVSIPVNGWSPPSNDQVAQFLSLFHDNAKEKVFVHCRFGEDRTGVFVAAYRMAYQNWPATQALSEMRSFGFNGLWHPSMKSFVRDLPARLKSAPSLVAYKPAEATVTK